MIELKIGDCRDVLKTLPDNSVNCCVTSPPYYGLRDYGVDGQIGLEKKHDCGAWTKGEEPYIAYGVDDDTGEEEPFIAWRRVEEIKTCGECYVCKLIEVFREVKRVLRDDGVLWLNLGDSYVGGAKKGEHEGKKQKTNKGATWGENDRLATLKSHITGLKNKDLIGIPWRVAFALQADGWYLRQDIIWSKNNPMPESVTDRCTKSHEYIFLLSKSAKYYFDNDAIKEPNANPARKNYVCGSRSNGINQDRNDNDMVERSKFFTSSGRNKRSVWQVNTKPYKGAHFATFPPSLIEPCIKAGTSEKGVCPKCGNHWIRITEHKNMVIRKTDRMSEMGEYGRTQSSGTMVSPAETITTGWKPSCSCNVPAIPATVLDPFGGSGTVGEVCNKLNRNAVLIELNPEYKPLILERTCQSLSCFEGAC